MQGQLNAKMREGLQVSDSKAKKDIVNFSVRFDPALHQSIEDALRAIPRSERPSMDAFIQNAVRLALVPSAEPTNVGSVPSLEHLPLVHDSVLTAPGMESILVSAEDKTWVSVLLKLLNSPFRAFAVAIKENLRTFLFGLISAEQLKARAKADEGRRAPDATEAGSFERGIAELSDLLDAAERSLDAPKKSPQTVHRKAR